MVRALRSRVRAPRLIPDAGRVWHRLWSVRLSLALAAVQGLYLVWPAFQDHVPLWLFAGGAMLMSVAVVLARITKQPGIE